MERGLGFIFYVIIFLLMIVLLSVQYVHYFFFKRTLIEDFVMINLLFLSSKS